MDALTTLSLSLGLAADAFAVSVSSGLSIAHLKPGKAIKIALFFGGFQMLMPLVGWLLSASWRSLAAAVAPWVAWALLCGLGAKAIYEALRCEGGDEGCNPADTQLLLGLAIATSLDALAAGVGLSLLQAPIWQAAGTIGSVTFAVCFAGVYLGRRIGPWIEGKVELAGGAILIAIGTKILLS